MSCRVGSGGPGKSARTARSSDVEYPRFPERDGMRDGAVLEDHLVRGKEILVRPQRDRGGDRGNVLLLG